MTDESVITHHANNRTNRRSFLKFRKIPRKCQNSVAKSKFRSSAPNSAVRGKLWALFITAYTHSDGM